MLKGMSIESLKTSVRTVLEDNILRFWIDKMQDDENGGFYGRIDGHNKLHPEADKGAILNARILWTFSAAYRVLKESRVEGRGIPGDGNEGKGVFSCPLHRL